MSTRDDNAKYLVDQFNKYASWRNTEKSVGLSQWPLVLTWLAVGISIVSLSWRITNPLSTLSGSSSSATTLAYSPLDIFAYFLMGLVVPLALVVLILVAYRMYSQDYKAFKKEHEDDVSRLLALENHRSRFNSLPSGITLPKIVKMKPDELEKLLKANEPSSTGSPKIRKAGGK